MNQDFFADAEDDFHDTQDYIFGAYVLRYALIKIIYVLGRDFKCEGVNMASRGNNFAV